MYKSWGERRKLKEKTTCPHGATPTHHPVSRQFPLKCRILSWLLFMGRPSHLTLLILAWMHTTELYGCDSTESCMDVTVLRVVWVWLYWELYGCDCTESYMGVIVLRAVWVWLYWELYECDSTESCMGVIVLMTEWTNTKIIIIMEICKAPTLWLKALIVSLYSCLARINFLSYPCV